MNYTVTGTTILTGTFFVDLRGDDNDFERRERDREREQGISLFIGRCEGDMFADCLGLLNSMVTTVTPEKRTLSR